MKSNFKPLQFLLDLVGVLLVIAGFIVLPLPIPLGLIMITLGAFILISSSRSAQRAATDARRKHPAFNARLKQLQKKVPRFIERVFTDTDPGG